jgi:hypothetical protein
LFFLEAQFGMGVNAVTELDQPVAGGIETFARCGFCVHKSLLFWFAASGSKDNTALAVSLEGAVQRAVAAFTMRSHRRRRSIPAYARMANYA